jgi:hypothetical protein
VNASKKATKENIITQDFPIANSPSFIITQDKRKNKSEKTGLQMCSAVRSMSEEEPKSVSASLLL